MGRGSLGTASSRASLGRSSMGPPGRWLAHAARPLGTRLALASPQARASRQPRTTSASRALMAESPCVGAGLGDQCDDDGDEDHADEFAAVLDRRMRSQHAARGVAGAQCYPQAPLNLAVYSEK